MTNQLQHDLVTWTFPNKLYALFKADCKCSTANTSFSLDKQVKLTNGSEISSMACPPQVSVMLPLVLSLCLVARVNRMRSHSEDYALFVLIDSK